MATLPGPNNAISYAQFRLQGGWKGTALLSGICLAILGGTLALQVAAAVTDGASVGRVLGDWPQGLVLLQVGLMMVVGPLQVTAAVRQDVNRRMVESHRLMPMEAAGVVAGYVGGGPWATLVLGGTVFGFGAACCVMGGGDPFAFGRANAILLVVGVCLWTVTVHLSMVSRLGILLLMVLVPMMMASDGGPGELIPGFGVITSPLVSRSALILARDRFSAVATLMGLGAAVAVAVICFRAASRAYRMPGVPGLSPALGLLLLGTWVGVSVAGLTEPDVFGLRVRYRGAFGPQVTASVTVAMLIASMPVAAAVRSACRGDGTGGDADRWAGPRAVGVTAAAVAFVVALPALAVLLSPHEQRFRLPAADRRATAMLVTTGVVTASIGGLACLFAVAYQRLERAWLIAFLWLLATWCMPAVVDSIGVAAARAEPGWAMGGSPVGAMSLVWVDGESAPLGGLLYQAVVAGGCAALAGTAWSNRRRRRAAAALA